MGKFISINGVSFNADAISKMSRKEFIDHPMHENHFLHLVVAKRKEAVSEVYDIIVPKKVSNGNSKRNDKPVGDAKVADVGTGKAISAGDKG